MQPAIPLLPSKYYHIYNRGNNGENIFIEERNYTYFMNLYARYINPIADTFAYCLLRNHFHLAVRIKDLGDSQDVRSLKDPGQQFSNFFNAYAKGINHTYRRTGSLFQNRFRRVEVTSDRYFMRLVHYIHWNPQKHGFIEDFRDYPYSSYHLFLTDKPVLVRRDEVLEWFEGRAGFVMKHQELTKEKDIQFLIDDTE